jgi:potassium uptake Trk family protein
MTMTRRTSVNTDSARGVLWASPVRCHLPDGLDSLCVPQVSEVPGKSRRGQNLVVSGRTIVSSGCRRMTNEALHRAIYSAQTMVDNLGFTLTPDSMIHFQDAIFPLLVMSFLAYAGNTCYPCFLRLVIWTMGKVMPKQSTIQEPINFLLDHPRRCYTLLFPSRPTWILFGILFALNFIDTVLIICLDLHNPAFAHLSPGERFVASLFQAASSRHTGTATFNLADVHPAVQFSLLVMMYISVFPIAISIRASNTYEEKSLGIYGEASDPDENKHAGSYVTRHLQNQLSFDLWYIFLGVFVICCAESDKIASEPANYSIFAILFEVVSAYGNVGLSIGYPTVLTSLCGKFTPFSKVVICAMMIRGRHRGLPVQLDRAIILPSERLEVEDDRASRISRIRSIGRDLQAKVGLGQAPTIEDGRNTQAA